MHKARNVRQAPFQRNGDLLFDLLGGKARNLRCHLGEYVGEFGIGLDRHLRPRVVAVDRHENSYADDHGTPMQAEIDEAVNH